MTIADRVRVVRGVPGTHQEWITATAHVTGLLLSVRGAESGGDADLPEPLRAGRALRAWGRVVRPVMDRRGGVVEVPAADLAVVADTAAALGRMLARARSSGEPNPVSRALTEQAALVHTTPEWIVAQVARVHGALTGTDPEDARLVWRAGAG